MLACCLQFGQGRTIIFNAIAVKQTHRFMRVGRIRSQAKSGFGSYSRALFLLFALPWGGGLGCLRQRKIRPGVSIIRIQLNCASGEFDLLFQVNPTRAVSKSQGTKECVICLRIFRARKLNLLFFATGKLCLK